ncbi:MAG: glutamine synthetase [Candidatus Latescibacteria bacterium]|jgi:glutamine synthetase|nr:glutamine synthetase [Candidatus Latescibacterota bacterium]
MDITTLENTFATHNIKKVKLVTFDMEGICRGKYVSLDKFYSAVESGMSFCDVLFGWDANDDLYDKESLTGWHTGYPDTLAKIDTNTFRIIPWEPDTALFIMDLYEQDGAPYPLSPRHLLQKMIDKARDLGFLFRSSAEYEFFFFDESSHTIYDKNFIDLKPLSPGMFGYSTVRASTYADLVHHIIDAMDAYDIELEGIHTETGPGVYEAAIRYDEGITSADKAALFKTGIKEIAPRHNLIATFMAKWNADLPGCSGHVHQSLWDLGGKNNLFADDTEPLSETARHYLGGLLHLLPAFTSFYCPNINSYKRAVPGVWSPINVSWGIENRTSAIRAIPGNSGKSTRLENRVCGADTNPYLIMAAGLAAGLYGIENKIEPGDAVAGNAYTDESLTMLPTSLGAAVDQLKNSKPAREILGDTFIDHYILARDYEVRLYEKAVTNWELKRYFEVI